jgi:hypothetical protein
MTGWLNCLFSILSGALSQNERDQLANVGASWVLLNTRNGRFFVDIIGRTTQLQNIEDKLIELGRDPIRIGVFDHEGTQIGNTNPAAWLAVARDVTPGVRPTQYIDIHRWAGWAPKNVS